MFTQAFLIGTFALSGALAQSSSAIFGGPLANSSSTTMSSISAQTTMNLFVDGFRQERLVGSVVAADACETTYELVCTAGEYDIGSSVVACDSQSILATYGPGFYEVSTTVAASGIKETIVETCSLAGTTQAVCSYSIGASAKGKHAATQSVSTYSADQINIYQVPITAGAEKLSGLPTCTEAANAAAPTGKTDVYKVLVVPGAAALLAAGFA